MLFKLPCTHSAMTSSWQVSIPPTSPSSCITEKQIQDIMPERLVSVKEHRYLKMGEEKMSY